MALSDWLISFGVFFGFTAIILSIKNANGIKVAKNNEKLFGRIDFYKKKWRRKNLVKIIISLIVIFSIEIVGMVLNNRWIFLVGGNALIIYTITMHNKMMAYVEEKVFNGKGKEE